MPLQNPFSPSRLRRRLSREILDRDKTSPERGGKFGYQSAAFQMDDETSPGNETRPSPSRSKKRSNRVEDLDQKGYSSPPRNSHTRPKSRERKRDGPTNLLLQSPPRCDVRDIADVVVSPALPYSKDFGSFDLTLCEADDRRCIVLVEYEDRVFLNGKQIYIMLDGTVTDRDGNPDKVLQRNYDCVLQEKRRIRKVTRGTSSNSKKNNKSGLTLMHEPKGAPRSSSKDEPDIAPSRLPRSKMQTFRKEDRQDIIGEMADIEGSFSDIIARLCEAILKHSKHGKNGRQFGNQDGGHSYEEISNHVNATLDRLIDQFQSVVELSTSIDDTGGDVRNTDFDDEALIEKWVSEAFNDKHEKKDEQKVQPKKEDCQNAKTTRKASGVRTVGTQIKERRIEKKDKEGQTELKGELVEKFDRSEQTEKRFTGMSGEEKLVRELREENRLLQGEIFALESEMRELQEQQQELEKRFEEEAAAKLAVMKQLSDMTGSKSKNRDESTNTGNRIRDHTEEEFVNTRKNEATSTISIAKCTVSSTSINSVSSVTSSESESLPPVDEATEPEIGMRQRSRALKSEIGRLRNVYSDVEEQLSKLAEENTNLRLRIGKLNREAKDVKNQMEQTDLACQEYRQEIKNLDKVNTQLEKKLAEMSKEKLFVEEKLRAANDELTKVDVDRRRAGRELADMQKKFENLTKEKQQLSQEFGKLEKAHLEASTKLAKQSKTNAESEVQLAVFKGQIGDMTIETNQLRGENQANSDGRQRAERENRKLESELKAIRKMNGELSGEVLQIRSKTGALEDTIRHLESDNAQLSQTNVHLEAAKEAFSKRASDAEASNQMISSSLKDHEAELYRLKRENFELRTTVEQMNMINTSIRARLDNWGKDSVDIGKRMKQLVGVKAELQSFIQQLTSVNTNIEERFEKMDSEYADLERKLQTAGKGEKDGEEGAEACTTKGNNSPVLQELD